ncbi:DNA-binding domain-containing protein [Tsuneonella mangrovi]|uniref:HvfC/BufC N-terminal domain-containing protein n=1 Tax=Tsuneonella mangrovi TaxID=1982042 RepID=UPI000BA2A091|nr:DNA-binding domain-containing protein [Tsuneonella mangrovi]
MTLAATQRAFMAQVLDEDAPLPRSWSDHARAGMAIYRNAYRARLIDALAETFPATRHWVGIEAFERAAAHHAIIHPPGGWTLDSAGSGFDETLAQLFAGDPEVGELAWLEWRMHMAFVARDAVPLDRKGFAALLSAQGDAMDLRLTPMPGLAVRRVVADIPAIWRSAKAGEAPAGEVPMLAEPGGLVVWRDGFQPVFRATSALEADCLAHLRDGATFGAICSLVAVALDDEARAAEQAGAMLARWIDDGMLAAPVG